MQILPVVVSFIRLKRLQISSSLKMSLVVVLIVEIISE